MNKLIVLATYLLFLLSVSSCGVDDELELQRDYLYVEDHLTSGNCDKALSAMLSMKEQSGDATYYKLLASSYACKAGFTVTGFFANEIIKIVAGAEILSGLSSFTIAQEMTNIDSLDYYYISKAVDTLVYSGGVGPVTKNPSATLRIQTFGSYGAADINSLLMYLLFVKNGMNMAFYGNSDATGAKGAGTVGTNVCLYQYADMGDADLDAYVASISGSMGVCDDTADEGSAELKNGDGSIKLDRACGLMTDFNNLIDVLSNLTIGNVSDADLVTLLSDVSTVQDAFTAGPVATFGLSNNLITVKNTDECVTEFTGSEEQVGFYMASFFETLHSR
ncbi:hypothetical protein [Halobacteriovorax sp. DPLXC-1]|uniref:hypothetical protein n=1 Tax=Halobacteriovorax sp. DPLXC-1 TaxID=3110771 RepID=UPI002FF330A9